MKTLYEILEVSENASKEIIEKAYKVLAKKYHPDLQPEAEKQKAEKMMKQLNEAYSILIDEQKRKEYDNKLRAERLEEQEKLAQNEYSNNSKQENTGYSNIKYNEMAENLNKRQQEIKKQYQTEKKIQKDIQKQYEQKYEQAYEGYLRSLGYKIKYKWTWKKFRDFLITILIICAICLIIWFFPLTHKMLVDFYNSNNVIRTIVDIIGNIFVGIWNGICSLFKK